MEVNRFPHRSPNEMDRMKGPPMYRNVVSGSSEQFSNGPRHASYAASASTEYGHPPRGPNVNVNMNMQPYYRDGNSYPNSHSQHSHGPPMLIHNHHLPAPPLYNNRNSHPKHSQRSYGMHYEQNGPIAQNSILEDPTKKHRRHFSIDSNTPITPPDPPQLPSTKTHTQTQQHSYYTIDRKGPLKNATTPSINKKNTTLHHKRESSAGLEMLSLAADVSKQELAAAVDKISPGLNVTPTLTLKPNSNHKRNPSTSSTGSVVFHHHQRNNSLWSINSNTWDQKSHKRNWSTLSNTSLPFTDLYPSSAGSKNGNESIPPTPEINIMPPPPPPTSLSNNSNNANNGQNHKPNNYYRSSPSSFPMDNPNHANPTNTYTKPPPPPPPPPPQSYPPYHPNDIPTPPPSHPKSSGLRSTYRSSSASHGPPPTLPQLMLREPSYPNYHSALRPPSYYGVSENRNPSPNMTVPTTASNGGSKDMKGGRSFPSYNNHHNNIPTANIRQKTNLQTNHPPNPPIDSTLKDTIGSTTPSSSSSKRARRKCTIAACNNRVVQGGLCIAHGAKRKICSIVGCHKNVKKAGLCSAHGPARKRCEIDGCMKVCVQGGKCIAHGAKKKLCKVTNCQKQSILSGMCKKHHDEHNGIVKKRKFSGKGNREPNKMEKFLMNENEDENQFVCVEVNEERKEEEQEESSRKGGPTDNKKKHKRGLSIFHEMNAVNKIIESTDAKNGKKPTHQRGLSIFADKDVADRKSVV